MNRDEQQPPVPLRPQGNKACTNCARIKCKCILRTDGIGCERCYRLKKTCTPSVSAKKRGPKRHGLTSRSARLEEKLDDLLSVLKSQHTSTGAEQRGFDDDSETEAFDAEDDTTPSSANFTIVTTPNLAYAAEISPEDAEECLRKFRDDMMAKEIILHRVVAACERNLDLLFGVLTFINWIHVFPMNKTFAAFMSQLAVGMIWDLGLQMPPPENGTRFCPPLQIPGIICQPPKRDRTIEERRAVLGAFVITSMASHSFKAPDGLRWSPYLDDYLEYLAHNSTVSQDHILIAQVKMQLIVNQATSASGKKGSADVPPLYVDALRAQLEDILKLMNGNSMACESNSMIFRLYHFTMLIIHESSMANSPTMRNEPDFKRHRVYQRCLDSTKAWLNSYFATPLTMYTSLPCHTFLQLFYILVCLHKILNIRDVAWNQDTAREVIDLSSILDRVIDTFEQLQAASRLLSPGNEDDEALSFGVKKFLALKMLWQNDLSFQAERDSGMSEGSIGENPARLSTPLFMDSFSFHMLPGMLDDMAW